MQTRLGKSMAGDPDLTEYKPTDEAGARAPQPKLLKSLGIAKLNELIKGELWIIEPAQL